VRNTSARAVDGIGVLFRIPNGVQFSRTADTQPAGGTCGGPATCVADTEWSWNLGTMAAGAMQTLTVSQTVQAALTEGSLISTSTWVTATGQTTAINVQTTAGDHR
jgi:hypothetical protein